MQNSTCLKCGRDVDYLPLLGLCVQCHEAPSYKQTNIAMNNITGATQIAEAKMKKSLEDINKLLREYDLNHVCADSLLNNPNMGIDDIYTLFLLANKAEMQLVPIRKE